MRSTVKVRAVLYSFLGLMTAALLVFGPGCGTVYQTDGRSVTILGFGHVKDQKSNTQIGWGKSLGSSEVARPGPWGAPSPAVGGGN